MHPYAVLVLPLAGLAWAVDDLRAVLRHGLDDCLDQYYTEPRSSQPCQHFMAMFTDALEAWAGSHLAHSIDYSELVTPEERDILLDGVTRRRILVSDEVRFRFIRIMRRAYDKL